MKIATWNVERFKHSKRLDEIQSMLQDVDADILVLTETDIRLYPHRYDFWIETEKPEVTAKSLYKDTERRVMIFSRYEICSKIDTYDSYTSCCAEIRTEVGLLKLYGTIIGIYGNRHENFKQNILKQAKDFKRLSENGHLCIAGDLNTSFTDNYYFTNFGRNALNKIFEGNNFVNLTKSLPEAIDHIAISTDFIKGTQVEIKEFNEDKKFSDHKGVCIIFKN